MRVLDRDWRAGKKLASYEITGEVADMGDSPRLFRAKLTYADVKEPVETNYYVVGIDPLLIFREEDYRKVSGM